MRPESAPSPEHARLIRKLESIADLSPEEREALGALPLDIKTLPEGADIIREGQIGAHCCLLIEGFMARYKVLGEGQRQIMSFHMAGDVPDLLSLQLPLMDHSLGTLTRSVVGFIPHTALRALIRAHPGVGDILWRDTLIDGSVFREWLVGVGRRSAHTRIAHLLCEIYVKMRAVGLADESGFMLPVSQVELGDALGLSAVHVNRVLQDLRRDGLISGQARKMMIGDWEGLKQAGDFDPLYLHIQKAA